MLSSFIMGLIGGLGIVLLALAVLIPIANYHNKKYNAGITWEPFAIAAGVVILYWNYLWVLSWGVI